MFINSCGNSSSNSKSSYNKSIQNLPNPSPPSSGQSSFDSSEQSYPSCAPPQVKRCYEFQIGELPQPEQRNENSIKLFLNSISFPDGPIFSPNGNNCKDTIKLDATYDIKPVDNLRNDKHADPASQPDIYFNYQEDIDTGPIYAIQGSSLVPSIELPYYGNEGSQPRIPITIQPTWNGDTPTASVAPDGIYGVEINAEVDKKNKEGKTIVIGEAQSATGCMVLDNTRPSINIVNPKDEEYLSINKPLMEVSYSDALSGVDLSSFDATLTHNGNIIDLTNRFNLSCDGANYQVSTPLEDGKYFLNTSIKDLACNPTSTSIVFYVCTNPPATPTITTPGDWFSEGTTSNVCATTTSSNISASLLYINNTYVSMQGSIPDPSEETQICFNNVSLAPGLLKAGANSVTVTVINNVGCRATGAGSVTLHPMIKKIIPSAAKPGDTVMILGEGFDAFDPKDSPDKNYVMIGNEKVPLFDSNGNPLYTLALNVSNPPDDPSNAPTVYDELTITIPQDAQTGLVIVVVNGVASGILNPQSNALIICKVPPDKVVSQIAGVGIGVQLAHQPDGSPAVIALTDFTLSTSSTDAEWKYGLEYTAWNSSANRWEQEEIAQVSNIPYSSIPNKFSLYIGSGVTVAVWTSYNSSTQHYELYLGSKWGSDGWAIQRVDSNVLNKKVSVAFDPNRTSTMAAYVGGDGILKLAHFEPGTGWIIDVVETPGNPGIGTISSIDGDIDLKVSPSGNAVIGYVKGIQTSLLQTSSHFLSIATGTFNSSTKQYQWTIEMPTINGQYVESRNPSVGFCAGTQVCITVGAIKKYTILGKLGTDTHFLWSSAFPYL